MDVPYYAQIAMAIQDLRQATSRVGKLAGVVTPYALDRAVRQYMQCREDQMGSDQVGGVMLLQPLEDICDAASEFRSIVNACGGPRFNVTERARYASAVNKLFKLRDATRRRVAMQTLRAT